MAFYRVKGKLTFGFLAFNCNQLILSHFYTLHTETRLKQKHLVYMMFKTSCSVYKRLKIADTRISLYIFNAVNASSPFIYRFDYCTEYFIYNQPTQNLRVNKNYDFEYERILRITNNKLN